MAYDGAKFAKISASGNANVAQVFGYATNDLLATVVGSDYFGSAVDQWNVKAMDVVHVRYDEDGTPGYAKLVFTSIADGAVTTAQSAVDGATWITGEMADVSTAGSVYVAAPFAGTIRRFKTILQSAITGANSAVELQLGGSTTVTGTALTIAYSGSAAGDVDEGTATAANAVTAGQAIEVVSDGASSTAAKLIFMIEIVPTVIQSNTTWVCGQIADVSTAGSVYVAAPYAGTIRKWYTCLMSTVASFGSTDCTLKLQLANVDVTGSDITISATGEAVGDVDSATCSAANTVTAGQAIEVVTAGESSGTIPVWFAIEIVPS